MSGWEDGREGGALDTPVILPSPPSPLSASGAHEILCLSQQALPSPEGWQTGEGPSWPPVLFSQDRGESYYGLREIGWWEALDPGGDRYILRSKDIIEKSHCIVLEPDRPGV